MKTLQVVTTLCVLVIINLNVVIFYLKDNTSISITSNATDDTVLRNMIVRNESLWNYYNNNQDLTTQTLKTNSVSTELFTKGSDKYFYKYIIENGKLCSRDGDVQEMFSLIILFNSAVDHFRNRQAIRNTWGSVVYVENKTSPVKLGFLLGFSSNTTLMQLVMEESLQHADIIQGHFYDTYLNLTLKSMMGLRWVTKHCETVKFLLKSDDDMYINVAKLIHTLTQLPVKSNVMYGSLLTGFKTIRNKTFKNYVPEEQFRGNVLPDFLRGAAYIISRDIIPKLYEVCITLPFLVVDDVLITGLCAKKIGAQLYNDNFFTNFVHQTTGCALEKFTSFHSVSVNEMNKIWAELQNPKRKCS